MTRPTLLDLFCGAGGAAVGYHRAGFDIVGVDNRPQPHYPYEFHQADALEFLTAWGRCFDVIHASPPCQGYTQLGNKDGRHPKLIEPVRAALHRIGRLSVIENVVGAPMTDPLMLCGSMFGLHVRRHRLFEASPLMLAPGLCRHRRQEIRAYYGKKGWLVWTPGGAKVQAAGRPPLLRGSVDQAPADMGIDWMTTWDELREAIPPAYTQFIGEQLRIHLEHATGTRNNALQGGRL
jgi:DNA (cytosine-5)-methyltransferase 1